MCIIIRHKNLHLGSIKMCLIITRHILAEQLSSHGKKEEASNTFVTVSNKDPLLTLTASMRSFWHPNRDNLWEIGMEVILHPQANEQLTPYFQGMLHPTVAYLGLGKLHRNKLENTTRLVRCNPTQCCVHHGSNEIGTITNFTTGLSLGCLDLPNCLSVVWKLMNWGDTNPMTEP